MKRNIIVIGIMIAMSSGCVLEEVKDCAWPNAFCGETCINIKDSDEDNCGECGYRCEDHIPENAQTVSGNVCMNGQCQYECIEGYRNVNTSEQPVCLENTSERQTCGEAGAVCDADSVCVNRECVANICSDTQTLCSTPEGNVCIDIHGADINNCGDCGKKCTENVPPHAQLKIENVCMNGQCQYECMTGYQNAGTSAYPICLDTTSDSKNCGEVGKICTFGEVCVNSQCVTNRCAGAQTLCSTPEGNVCIDIHGADINNCGACGYRCEAKPFAQEKGCREGKCEYECHSGYGNIGTATQPICVNLNEDVENCGSVGHNCRKMPNADIVFCHRGTCMAFSCVCGSQSGGKCMELCNYDCTTNVWTGTSTDGGGCANGYATMEMTDHSANLKDAAQDCAKRGMRLPTCNELTSVSQSALRESMSHANYWCANDNSGEGHGNGLGHNCAMPGGGCGSHDVMAVQKYRCVKKTADLNLACRCD